MMGVVNTGHVVGMAWLHCGLAQCSVVLRHDVCMHL